MQYDVLEETPSFPEYEGAPIRQLDYLGYAPCPFRHELQRQMHAHFSQHESTAGKVEWFSPSGCGEGNDPYDLIWKESDEAGMPGVISDGGSSDFFRQEGYKNWIETGVYGPIDKGGLQVRPEFAEAGIEDPMQAMHIYAAFPNVFLVDKQVLGERPVPRSWAELANPIYQDDITISGHHGDIPDVLLFNTWKHFGDEGLKAFGKNVRQFWSPAQMAKTAGSRSPSGTAIYVLNNFFAVSNRHKETVELVWPQEGAWFNPLMILAKRNRRPVSQLAVDYLLSEEWAQYLASIGLPPVHVFAGQKPLPGKLSWMGWDFARSHNLDTLRPELNAIFESERAVCN
jgi:ABC-type Fe3+ transport system substrate-binding protein